MFTKKIQIFISALLLLLAFAGIALHNPHIPDVAADASYSQIDHDEAESEALLPPVIQLSHALPVAAGPVPVIPPQYTNPHHPTPLRPPCA